MCDKIFQKNGSAYIKDCIEKAALDNTRTAKITGNWIIDTAVRIPSDFTLVLDGCHLKMADGSYSNMFVNENHDTEIGKTVEGTDRSISIVGKNNPIFDGGKYNGLREGNHSKNGLPPIWKNNVAFTTNPFELFLDFGNKIKARSKAEQTFIVQLCWGCSGYLPTEKAEKAGHYSAYI